MLTQRWRQMLTVRGLVGCRCCIVACNSTQATNTAEVLVDPDVANAKPFDDMPGIKGVLGILTTMKDFLPFVGKFGWGKPISIPEIHMDLYKQKGVICRLDMPGKKYGFVFTVDPEDVRKVLLHEGRYPYRELMPSLSQYRKTRPDLYPNMGLLSENGERWHHVRSKVQVPMLRPQITETYMPKMEAVSTDFVERIHSLRDAHNEVPDFLNELYRWSLESTGLVAFNTRLGCLSPESSDADSESQRMIQATIHTFEALLQLEIKNPWNMFSSKSKSKAKLDASQEYIRSIAAKYCGLTLDKIKGSTNAKDEDFGIMGQLLQRDDLDITDIHTFALDLLMAGIETTAHSFAFTLYLLARNMTEQKKVMDEIDRVLPSPDTPITPQLLHDLRLVRATVKEGMRMMAALDGTIRVLDHDISLSGYRVPAGAIIFLATQIASLLPQNFTDPNKFLPERWLSPTKPHPYANLPFGHGPRSCVGRRIALQELHLLLIKILQKYRVEYHHEDIRRISRLVSYPDKPLRISFVNRK